MPQMVCSSRQAQVETVEVGLRTVVHVAGVALSANKAFPQNTIPAWTQVEQLNIIHGVIELQSSRQAEMGLTSAKVLRNCMNVCNA